MRPPDAGARPEDQDPATRHRVAHPSGETPPVDPSARPQPCVPAGTATPAVRSPAPANPLREAM
jgi:hypothetical protein